MPDGGNPFFVISETNQPPCQVEIEDTDLLSVGREYRLTVLARGVENTDKLRMQLRQDTGSQDGSCHEMSKTVWKQVPFDRLR